VTLNGITFAQNIVIIDRVIQWLKSEHAESVQNYMSSLVLYDMEVRYRVVEKMADE
jgi:hypothetical protein